MEPQVETIEEEVEIPTEEIVGAIEAELNEEPELIPEPGKEPEFELEPEPTIDAEPEPIPEPEQEPEKEPEPEPEKPPAEPEPEKEPEPAEEKPSDEFGALEKDTPERTRERFEAVKGKYDEVTEERDALIVERDAVKAESDQWVKAITETGTNPEQFSMSLEYLTLVNSNKPEDLEKAYNIMAGEVAELGKTLGKAGAGYNPLDEHPDLKEKVNEGLMDETDAQEVAEARATIKLNTAAQAVNTERTDHQTGVSNALEEVKQLGLTLKANDPNFEAKVKILSPIIESVVSSGTPPHKWKTMIEATYRKIPEPAVVPITPNKPNVPDPLRPSGASQAGDGLDKEPGSTFEAISASLDRGY